MSRCIVHSDGVEFSIPEEWKCNFIENFVEVSDDTSAPVPVQYSFNPVYFQKEIVYYLSMESNGVVFSEMIEECLDFWNYLDCKDRMYFFYYVIFEYFLSDEKFPHSKCKIFYIKHFLNNKLKNIHNKDYYRELENILIFLIIFRSDGGYNGAIQLTGFIYGNEDIFLDFIVYSSVNFNTHKSKNYNFPMILSIIESFYIINTAPEYQEYENDEVEYLEKIIKNLIERVDWKDECILDFEVGVQYYNFFRCVNGAARLWSEIKNTNFHEFIMKKNWKLHLDIIKDLCDKGTTPSTSEKWILSNRSERNVFEYLTTLPREKLIFNPNVEFYVLKYRDGKDNLERGFYDEKRQKIKSKLEEVLSNSSIL